MFKLWDCPGLPSQKDPQQPKTSRVGPYYYYYFFFFFWGGGGGGWQMLHQGLYARKGLGVPVSLVSSAPSRPLALPRRSARQPLCSSLGQCAAAVPLAACAEHAQHKGDTGESDLSPSYKLVRLIRVVGSLRALRGYVGMSRLPSRNGFCRRFKAPSPEMWLITWEPRVWDTPRRTKARDSNETHRYQVLQP